MPLIIADRVMETSVTTGTGTVTLDGAVAGFRTFGSVCTASDTVPYSIAAVDNFGAPTGDWETGIGTWSAGTLARTTVHASSNAGALVNFAAGTKRVSLTLATNVAVVTDNTVTLTNKTISGSNNTITNVSLSTGVTGTLPATSGGTGQTSYAVGDLLYASTTSALSKLADVATGNALISGGVGVAPSWGKVTLTAHVSGVLPVANGGTNASSAGIAAFNNITGYSAAGATGTTSTNLVFSTSPTLTTPTLAGTASGTTAGRLGYSSGVLSFGDGSVQRSVATLDGTQTLTNKTLSAPVFNTTAAVTAGTNAQGQGALTGDLVVVTTAASNPSGVTLPTATTGRRMVVVNKGANPINIYPATSAYIDALAINTSIQLPVGGVMCFDASSTTQWYSSVNYRISVTNATGILPVASGGTGATTLTGLLKGNGTSAFTAAVAGTDYSTSASVETLTGKTIDLANNTLTGTLAQFNASVSDGNIATVDGVETLTNKTISGVSNTITNVSLSAGVTGTLAPTSGGTGLTSYAVGDLLYASGTSTIAALADVATGNALISGGVGAAPSWGKIALTTHISGVLPVANGGTNASAAGIAAFNNITGYTAAGATGTTSTNLVFSTSPTLTTPTLAGTASGTTAGRLGYLSGALSFGDGSAQRTVATLDGTQTLTGKTFNLSSNTLTGTLAQFNAALSDGDFATLGGVETFTGNKTFSGLATLGEVRSVNSLTQKFSQYYVGTSYLMPGEFQEICTVTPASPSQNYVLEGTITVSSGANLQIIHFTTGLRSNTLPDLSWSITYWEELVGGVRYVDPVLWTKETTTAAAKLALNVITQIFGNVFVEMTVHHRGSTYADVVMNTNSASELASVPVDYTSNAFTKLYGIDGTTTFTGAVAASSFSGSLTGNASTATALATSRDFSASGDATAPAVGFTGAGNVNLALTLASVGTPGTYRSVTVDAKGRVTAGTNPTTLEGYGITNARPAPDFLLMAHGVI
jgi:hypothetical protein